MKNYYTCSCSKEVRKDSVTPELAETGLCPQCYTKKQTEEKEYLCYSEIHVDDQTFYTHTIVKAKSVNEALNKLSSRKGNHYHLQVKGCLGELTLDLVRKFLSQKEQRT